MLLNINNYLNLNYIKYINYTIIIDEYLFNFKYIHFFIVKLIFFFY
jgi:hypothetical protein